MSRAATRRHRARRVAASVTLVLATITGGANADAWTHRKCELYAGAWDRALDLAGTEGVGAEFIARHDAFVASGCVGPARACPVSDAEIRLADILTVASMNEGMASTFAPFACPGISPAPDAPEPERPLGR